MVDDQRDTAETLAALLAAMGYEVRCYVDPREALIAAGSFRPELAFLDLGMPELTGYELAERLRKTAGLERIVLIAVSGYVAEADRAKSRRAGFDAHLAKPIDMALLERALQHFGAVDGVRGAGPLDFGSRGSLFPPRKAGE